MSHLTLALKIAKMTLFTSEWSPCSDCVPSNSIVELGTEKLSTKTGSSEQNSFFLHVRQNLCTAYAGCCLQRISPFKDNPGSTEHVLITAAKHIDAAKAKLLVNNRRQLQCCLELLTIGLLLAGFAPLQHFLFLILVLLVFTSTAGNCISFTLFILCLACETICKTYYLLLHVNSTLWQSWQSNSRTLRFAASSWAIFSLRSLASSSEPNSVDQ